MEIFDEQIICENHNNKEFKLVKFRFNMNDDSFKISDFKQEGTALANKLNPMLARDATKERVHNTILTNAIAGVISEWVWRHWLNKKSEEEGKCVDFEKTELMDITNQIDISATFIDDSTKTIEVRSSFPYTGIKNGVCRVFDIIGWYSNQVKVNEIKKDYYVRCLFPYNSNAFLKLLSSNFDVYLAGGATKELLENSGYSKNKKFIPYDEINVKDIKLTEYRVIEPIINAYDTYEITSIILFGKNDV